MRRAAVVVTVLVALAGACGGGGPETMPIPRGRESVSLDPGRFVTRIDNPYWPMAPGTRWVYRETDADGTVRHDEVTVTTRTKRIAGIEATVVHDLVTEGGDVVEDTWDWYAQDVDGNVWYLGEETTEYEDGAASTAGSWQTGVHGAQPGIVVLARPAVGVAYRQEYLAGEAEDRARVLALDARAEVPAGTYDRVLLTRETTPLEPGVVERKFYARGVGPVLATANDGGREELVRFERPG